MSESNSLVLDAPASTPVENPVKAKPSPKKTPKKVTKVATKKVPKKPAKKAAKAADRGMGDSPVADRRLALVKLLRKMGAFGATSARPISLLAEKLGYTKYDVYCLAYHKFPLAKQGLVKTVKMEDQRDLCVHLTAKGKTVDPE